MSEYEQRTRQCEMFGHRYVFWSIRLNAVRITLAHCRHCGTGYGPPSRQEVAKALSAPAPSAG